MLLKPPGWRAGIAYPTIAYVHGGPVGQDGFEFDSTSQMLAAQGYLVVNPNYRGSSGRGKQFSRAIYADWGKPRDPGHPRGDGQARCRRSRRSRSTRHRRLELRRYEHELCPSPPIRGSAPR